MAMDDIKSIIRKEKIKSRKNFSGSDVERLSEKICARILASEEYKKAKKLLIYNAANGEADLSAIAAAARLGGKTVAYPLCLKGRQMAALVPEDDGAFVRGAFGIMEPDINRSRELAPEELDLVICPLTAFDESCRRLGMGGGYYDRYLPKCKNAVIAAAAYEMQKADEIPVEENDVLVDIIFTESNVYKNICYM
jgi:5-formyltetrahydrofolate cyclo-ligase